MSDQPKSTPGPWRIGYYSHRIDDPGREIESANELIGLAFGRDGEGLIEDDEEDG